MKFKRSTKYSSWGRVNKDIQRVFKYKDFSELKKVYRYVRSKNSKILAYGKGRSYGETCINSNGYIFDTTHSNKVIEFDEQSGVIRCLSGITFEELVKFTLPKGYFLPVSPGSKYVSLGGAIANDVHGKNHIKEGSLGCHIKSLCIKRSDMDGQLICSAVKNSELFFSTIGGLGLTGIIEWAEINLKKVNSSFMLVENEPFYGLQEFINKSAKFETNYEYVVAWVDCFSKKGLRGIITAANHSNDNNFEIRKKLKLRVPFELPRFILNRVTIKIFNIFYFYIKLLKKKNSKVYFDDYFYPLDNLKDWNKMYGSRGFYQYQFVIPISAKNELESIFKLIKDSKQGSFLSVLKVFGDIKSGGFMSFPSEGYTLALDFPNKGQKTMKLFNEIDEIVKSCGGALYPAKDSRKECAMILKKKNSYHKFVNNIDPLIESNFSRMLFDE